jgi:hypothetical protein
MSLFYVRNAHQQLFETGAEDGNSLRLHVSKKFRLVSAQSNAYMIFKITAIL